MFAAQLTAALWDKPMAAWGVFDFFKLVILIAAGIAIIWIALKALKVTIPEWAVQMFWVVLIAVAALIALNLVASL